MHSDLLTLGLGFLEGFALIISPCILPILPIILAGSLTGSKKRPLGIILGFVLTFSLFTFFSRKLVQYSGLDLNLVRHFSYSLLFVLGFVMISTQASAYFTQLTQRFAKVGYKLSEGWLQAESILGGLFFGSLVAFIWTPCAGPILAAVIVQTVIQKTSLLSFLTLLSFSLGAAGPMLLIAIFGRKIMLKLPLFNQHAVFFRKLLGLIIIVTVGYLFYAENAISAGSEVSTTQTINLGLEKALEKPYPAPAIGGITEWINSPALVLQNLKGKVVLIDFWTYSCINCLRTLPFIKAWYQRYHDKGLVIIGIHTPEFDFEKDLTNVKAAVLKAGIPYPVALDSQYVTWQNFANLYWPAQYLIDKNGEVVYTHFGEGEERTTENNIRFLLELDAQPAQTAAKEPPHTELTPETYLGYVRAARYASLEAVLKNQKENYTYPQELAQNFWALQGEWFIKADSIMSAGPQSKLKVHFKAHKVFMVMGTLEGKPLTVKFLLNGKPLPASVTSEIKNSAILVNRHRLYEILSNESNDEGILEILPTESGLEVYTFTFG